MMVDWPLIVFVMPLVGMVIAYAAVVAGWRKIFGGFVVIIALLAGSYNLAAGLDASCRINESECIGATATVYLVGAVWAIAALTSLLLISRVRAATKLGSESEK